MTLEGASGGQFAKTVPNRLTVGSAKSLSGALCAGAHTQLLISAVQFDQFGGTAYTYD